VKSTPEQIWQEYQKGVSYNTRIGLYDQVKKNENFYIGKQWEGLNAPDLNKPVINVLKRVVSYFISMIVSDDIGASFTPFHESPTELQQAQILTRAVDTAIEMDGLKAKTREIIRDAAVDGDAFLHFYFDAEAETGEEAQGRIVSEVLPNINVIYGNPYSDDLQRQPYVLIVLRKTLESVREEARSYGQDERLIHEDSDSNQYDVAGASQDGLVTVIIKYAKENGKIRAVKVTNSGVVRPEWEVGYGRYPLACMRWEKIKNSYHGAAAISAMIPNQISINQLFAMGIHSVKTTAFPKVMFDRTKIKSWSSKVGQAIGVTGNPNDAIYSGFKAPDMSSQVLELIERLTQKTLEFMGASDAALGNINPDNTSAIIATQKASAMPLELQRLEFFRFTEEYIRVIMDMISVHYGIRKATFVDNDNTVTMEYDYSTIRQPGFKLNVDVGAAAYWSEVMQIQTLDNLFAKGIIPDAITYLKSLPDGYVPKRGELIKKLEARMSVGNTEIPPGVGGAVSGIG